MSQDGSSVGEVARIESRDGLGASALGTVERLLDAATTVDGVTPLDEGRWRQLHQGNGFIALLAWQDDQLVAYDHLQPDGGAPTTGHHRAPPWSLAVATAPGFRLEGRAIAEDLAAETAKIVANAGGGAITLWASQPRPDHEVLAARLGLYEQRALYQMRRPLPVGESFELTTRAFRPGHDEQEWLMVNNRAFAWHPEQGGWDLAEIEAHETLEWFDPEGFLVHEVDGKMAGFCWTKIHAQQDPPLGEIYVIATDPDFAGAGLGRRLTLAGLDHMAQDGIRIGMLYVDAFNTRAVKLYVDLGFVVHHVDVNFSAGSL